MVIDSNLEKLLSNFYKVIEKMLKIVKFWTRLKLSLPGRIAVAKTFLLSQINHIGCITMPSNYQVEIMQSIIDNFSLGTLKFSKDYLYCLPKKGGLGLINIREFFISQHTMWFKRAYHSTRDNWRIDMCRLGFGNPFTVACSDLSRKQHPILYDLCASFSLFRDEYYSIGTNYKLAFILNNHMFKRDLKSDKILDVPFFGGKNNPDLFKISNIRNSDCWVGN